MMVNKRSSRLNARAAISRTLIAAAVATFARAAVADPAPAPVAPQETVTEELIRMLAKHNALSKADAAKLIERLRVEKAPSATAAAPTATPTTAAAPAAPTDAAAAAAAAAAADKSKVRVIYVPESEKQKIREEVKAEVLAEVKNENWAQPKALPEWVKHISIEGDLRYRQEGDFYDNSNDPNIINFQAINSGSPTNTNFTSATAVTLPYLDARTDRELPRFRARLGLNAQVAEQLTASFRFNSGNNTNPVSTDQTLGTDFNKTTFVIDRAYFDYHPNKAVTVLIGRAPNPWKSTDLLFDGDLNFDGVSGQFRPQLSERLQGRITAGAFSIENTAIDFPSTTTVKGASRDKWLFAAQLGLDFKLRPGITASGSVAYYDYYHLSGRPLPCDPNPLSASIICASDKSRPGFVQQGNTLIGLRTLTPTQTTDPTYQYFGLATPYRVFDVPLSADVVLNGPLHAVLDLDYARNLAYHRRDIVSRGPVNNFSGCPASDPNCVSSFAGGNEAYLVQLRVGYATTLAFKQWNAFAGYKRIESDAVVDAFNDSDFHRGGSNAKGYFVGANLGLLHDTWLTLRYLSATEVTGPPLAIDVLQFDLNARF